MKTLAEFIVSLKCRKGPSAGVTNDGRFWHAFPKEITIRNDEDDIFNENYSCALQIRHFENNKIQLVIITKFISETETKHKLVFKNELLEVKSVKDLIAGLKNSENGESLISRDYETALDFLASKKFFPNPMLMELPGPDEI